MNAIAAMNAAEIETIRHRLAGNKIKVTDVVAVRAADGSLRQRGIVYMGADPLHPECPRVAVVFPSGERKWFKIEELVRVAPSFPTPARC